MNSRKLYRLKSKDGNFTVSIMDSEDQLVVLYVINCEASMTIDSTIEHIRTTGQSTTFKFDTNGACIGRYKEKCNSIILDLSRQRAFMHCIGQPHTLKYKPTESIQSIWERLQSRDRYINGIVNSSREASGYPFQKRDDIVFTTHAKLRCAERQISQRIVKDVVRDGEHEYQGEGCTMCRKNLIQVIVHSRPAYSLVVTVYTVSEYDAPLNQSGRIIAHRETADSTEITFSRHQIVSSSMSRFSSCSDTDTEQKRELLRQLELNYLTFSMLTVRTHVNSNDFNGANQTIIALLQSIITCNRSYLYDSQVKEVAIEIFNSLSLMFTEKYKQLMFTPEHHGIHKDCDSDAITIDNLNTFKTDLTEINWWGFPLPNTYSTDLAIIVKLLSKTRTKCSVEIRKEVNQIFDSVNHVYQEVQTREKLKLKNKK